MAEPKENPFLDDPEDLMTADSDELIDITDEDASKEQRPSGAEELKALTEERDELKDRLLRALADVENVRKRGERDRREAENYGGSKLARDMLPVYDNLRRALDAASDEHRSAAGPILEGIELTMRELLNVFSKHGIKPISPEIGDAFDPQQHQAMFEAPVPNTQAGSIIQVMVEGFMLHDRLLRPAQVGVSSKTN